MEQIELPTPKFKLGQVARDMITGYTGVITSVSFWLNGCITYGLQSRNLDKDGKPVDRAVFDEPQIELMEERPVVRGEHKGGPARDDARPSSKF